MRTFSSIAAGVLAIVANSLFLLARQPVFTRLDGSEITPTQIAAAVTKSMQAANVTGAGIAIFNRGEIVYLKTFGFRDAAKHLLLPPDSVMTAASLTKPVFATMAMELVHQRIISLEKPVYKYLPRPLPEYPGYTDLGGDPRYRAITMRMLLDRTSGFPNWRSPMPGKKLRIYFQPARASLTPAKGSSLPRWSWNPRQRSQSRNY